MQTLRRAVGAGVAALAAQAVLAQTCIDNICFVDRGAGGQISLGAYRGGIGVIDYDNDGWMDLIIGDSAGKPNRLFRNVPNAQMSGRTFVDVTAGSGLDDAEGTARDAVGVVAADYDNDGDSDVYIVGRDNAAVNHGLLYRNNGDGTFTNVSVAAGLRVAGAGAEAAGWADYDLDGDLDLMVVRFTAPYRLLFDNNGDGTFTNVSAKLPAIPGFSHCYTVTWADYDLDGWSDALLVSNAGANTEVLFRNVPDGNGGRTLVNVAQQAGYTAHGPAPMGIAVGDYDNDGDFDLGISDALTGTYYRNNGDGTLTKAQLFSTMFGWGVDWLDADNDGLLDFYTAGSWASANFDNLQRNLGGGAFANVSPALNGVSAATQYSVQLDLDNNGRQDLVAVAPNNFVSIYENVSASPGRWLRVNLRGVGGGLSRDAIGAIIRVTAAGKTLHRTVISGSSTTASEDLRQHFGLGAAAVVDSIEVVWPRAGTLAERTESYAGPFAADHEIILAPQKVCADLNNDGKVDQADLGVLLSAYQSTPAGDLTGDDQTDQADLGVLLSQYGQACR